MPEKQITIPASQIYMFTFRDGTNTLPDNSNIYFQYTVDTKDGRRKTYRDININLSKAARPELNMLAAEVGIPDYRKMKKQELVIHLKHWIKFEIPESMKADYERIMTNILDVYYDVPQTFIPVSQQTKIGDDSGPVKFWLSKDPNTRYSEHITSLTIKEIRNICKHIGINGYSKWKRHELIELLEDKLVFEEQGS
jgi:hypothetical protein